MNTNSGHDPMLSSFIGEWCKANGATSATASPALVLSVCQPPISSFTTQTAGLLSPEHNPELCDLTSLWSHHRKRVLSIKMEDEDSFPSYAVTEGVNSADIGVDNADIGVDNADSDMDIDRSTVVIDIKSEIEDNEYGDVVVLATEGSQDYKHETNTFHMTEAEARRYVEQQFENIAFVPRSDLNQREKIQSILAQSDCTDFSVDDILNFDKKCPDSARACAKIVQNIPQRYRWECVLPEDIPCCYTIVADCKKLSNRDKPPRPMNAFMIWAQGARRLINELCPKMQNALISEALGYYWRQKSDAFKLRFEQEKMKLRRFHNVEFPEYKYKPKTKVQKAKEKQELFLSKAKLRASVKLEKLQKTEETIVRRTHTKSGRPKKVKLDPIMKDRCKSPSTRVLMSETAAGKSPTKPAIKDMLTLKILNDRRSKEVTTLTSRSQEFVLCSFGQLSPSGVDSSGLNDITDNQTNFETVVHPDQDTSSKVVTSSVFDTPANTPPVEEDDDHHYSPPHPQQTSTTAVCSEPAPSESDILPINQTLLSSFQTVQILPVRTISSIHTGPSLLDLITRRTSPQTSPVTPTQVTDFTDLLFTYVTEALTPAQQQTSSITRKHSRSNNSVTDANNNSTDMNNNYNSDVNNNNTDLPTSSATCSADYKLILSPSENCDLDTLFLDLNVPILSDDDLRSIMNSL